MVRRKEVKEYAIYPPPWWDNHGSGCVDPEYGIGQSFIKDKIKIPVSIDKISKKFPITLSKKVHGVKSISFISQDGLIFYLWDNLRETAIYQIYFDDYHRYPPNIKNARKETTAFKRWLLGKI